MNKKYIKIADMSCFENSYITFLAKNKIDNIYGIFYFIHDKNKIIQLYSSNFGNLYRQIILNFNFGYTIGAIVGLARERTHEDKWYSDTIERSILDKNSIHQGILRIINKEDGIPVFARSTQTVGNISPALAYLHKGNFVEIRKALNQHNLVQKSIMAKILEGKPSQPQESLVKSYCAGEGYKSESRRNSIRRSLDNLVSAD